MDRIKAMLSKIENLSSAELDELKQLILREFDKSKSDPDKVVTTDEMSLLASAATAHRAECERRTHDAAEMHSAEQTLRKFRTHAADVI